MNERCNYLQSILGIFYHSTSVPEKVIKTLAHTGLSISLTSIHQAVTLLSKEAAKNIRHAVHCLTTSFAYNNFDINFTSPKPTVENPSKFISATLATAIPLFGVESFEVLCCSQQLWEKNPWNPSPDAIPIRINLDDLQNFHLHSVTNKKNTGDKMSPLLMNYAWHVQDILVHCGEYFLHLLWHLGQIEIL